MSNYVYARPYAKAIFYVAVAEKTLQQWSDVLLSLAATMREKMVIDFMENPKITYEQQGALFADVVAQFLGDAGKNLIQILTENTRLSVLPEIYEIYERLRANYENTVKVRAVVTETLTPEQQSKLEEALQKRLQKKIILQCEIDKKLLGGIVIYVGDNVIDGSLINRLNQLKKYLLS